MQASKGCCHCSHCSPAAEVCNWFESRERPRLADVCQTGLDVAAFAFSGFPADLPACAMSNHLSQSSTSFVEFGQITIALIVNFGKFRIPLKFLQTTDHSDVETGIFLPCSSSASEKLGRFGLFTNTRTLAKIRSYTNASGLALCKLLAIYCQCITVCLDSCRVQGLQWSTVTATHPSKSNRVLSHVCLQTR